MELLAPVNADTLQAALDAGADAVYFGLTRLNARRGARNFSSEELPEVISRIHAAGAKAHLTLNIDLAGREIGLAARTLQLAAEAGVDAVIVRDAAVLSLIPHFPQLQFHLSTQAGVSSSAGVQMAKELGCHRVVLARELTKAEIAAASAVEGIETEVFVQGAMCFCCSGRCLLSSWVGGRSGNRGTCASPCRVAWKSTTGKTAHPMSMHDLCLLDHLDELREMGVASLKIEGRLKSASWVSRAVSLYRKALDGLEPLENLHAEAAELGNYTGRTLSSAYYSCHFDNLTDEDTGRRTTQPTEAGGSFLATPAEELSSFQISVHTDSQRGTCFDLRLGICRGTFRLPWQRIATPKRATTLGEILREAESALPNGLEREISCPAELARTLLPRRCAGTLLQEFQEFLRRATKEDDGQVRIALPPALAKQLASPAAPAPANCRPLNDSPDCIRLGTSQINYIQLIENKQVTYNIKQFIVACSGNFSLEMLWNRLPDSAHGKFLLALPPVIYESALPRLQKALTWAKSQDLLVEVNSWDTLQLAREANVNFVAGPGLAVLNALSADFLHQFGAAACAVSPEIDEEKFAELCQNCAVPLTATVFSRPALMTTRAELPLEFAPQPDGQPGAAFEDSRGTRLCAWRDEHLTILRPESPFDWRRLSSPRIRVAHLVVDLSGSPDPMHDLASLSSAPFLFNFDRTLK